MRTFFRILLPVLILVAVYKYRDPLGTRIVPLVNQAAIKFNFKSAPCEEPIIYTLGTFDEDFKISQSYFLAALLDAEEIWEKDFGREGRELFSYGESATGRNVLDINLVYDYRQQATNQLTDLGVKVEDSRASYDELRAKLSKLRSDYGLAKEVYSTEVKSFNARQKAYEEKVEYWNAQGGAPKKEYDELQAEKMALNKEVASLKKAEAALNGMVDEINSLVVVINRIARTLNLSVEEYNNVGATLGESFEEGVYIKDGAGARIDIYEFSSRAKLVRVLAHELGHALGLEHVQDPKAIMYELNQGNSMALSTADILSLNTLCQIE